MRPLLLVPLLPSMGSSLKPPRNPSKSGSCLKLEVFSMMGMVRPLEKYLPSGS